jgi:apolipoprotein N-acyltransferase
MRKLLLAALIGIPLALSFVPHWPVHGYGIVLLLYPVFVAIRDRALRKRLLLYGLGLLLQLLAYPDPDLGFLGWVLLWPYLLARECDDKAPWFRSAFLYGYFRAFTGFYWLGNVHYTAWLGVSIASGLAFAVAFEWPLRRLTFLPYALRVAATWLLFEGVHAFFLGGFPWLFLAHTQYRFRTLIQIADLVGAFGVSFLLAFVQAAALEAIRGRRLTASLGVAGALLLATLLYGATRGGPGGPEGPGILMVQTSIPSYVKEQELADPRGPRAMDDALTQLTAEGLEAHPDAALIVWPETMFPMLLVEDNPVAFLRYSRRYAHWYGKPAVYGLNSISSIDRIKRGFNAAVLCDREGSIRGIYRKQRLVPMSEEFLLRRILPDSWSDKAFAWISRNFGLPASCDLEEGEGFVTLDAGPGLRCAVLICFEGLYPDLVRGAVSHEHPDLLLHLVNNGWFLEPPFLFWKVPSFEQRQCVASWVFRAVETRTPFFSCANAGITCAVAPDGRILGSVDKVLGTGSLYERVPPRWPDPPFLHGGFLLPPALLLLLLPLFLWRARRRAPGAPPDPGSGA